MSSDQWFENKEEKKEETDTKDLKYTSFYRVRWLCATDKMVSKHRDTGIRNIAMIIGAEYASIGFYYTHKHDGISLLIISLLIFSCWFAILCAKLSHLSCKRSYNTSLEYTSMILKIIWALGLYRIKIQKNGPPLSSDLFLYVPRFITDRHEFKTTEEHIKHTMEGVHNNTTTYAWLE